MATTYSDYNRDRIGWFFGLSGWQLAHPGGEFGAGVLGGAAGRLDHRGGCWPAGGCWCWS